MSAHMHKCAHNIIQHSTSEVTHEYSSSFTVICWLLLPCVHAGISAHGLFLFALLVNTGVTQI